MATLYSTDNYKLPKDVLNTNAWNSDRVDDNACDSAELVIFQTKQQKRKIGI